MKQSQGGHGAREIGVESVFGEMEGAEEEADGLEPQGGERREI